MRSTWQRWHTGPLGGPLGDVLVGAHWGGWPKMTKAFFKLSSSCSARFSRARRAHFRVAGYFCAAYLGHELRCCQR